METKSNHEINDEVNAAEKIVDDASKQIMDFYTNQINAVTGFYKNLHASSSTVSKEWSSTDAFSNNYFNNELTKAFIPPFNGLNANFVNPFLPMFDKLYQQILSNSSAMFSSLNNGIKSNDDMIEVGKNYQNMISSGMVSSNDILKTVTGTYNKQLAFLIENNNKVIEEVNNQLTAMLKQNQKFWSDLMMPSQPVVKTEEKVVKDSIIPETKKPSAALVTEFSNHKI